MEITINIPENTYSVPTEVRSEVVQIICNAFLTGGAFKAFHPYSDGPYRPHTLWVGRYPKVMNHPESGYFYVFTNEGRCRELGLSYESDSPETYFRIRGCEMKAAFVALRKAGYHIFKCPLCGWPGYIVSEKPYVKEGREVSEFTDFID